MKLSIRKYIELNEIITAKYTDEIDREIDLLTCLTGKPAEYFLNLNLHQWNKERAILQALNLDNITAKPAKYITANGNTYAPVYNFSKLTAGQLVDITHFLKEPEKLIPNLPQIMACFCLPTKRGLFGRKTLKYLTVPHSEVSKDMESANIFDAYAIAVFFYLVLRGFLSNTAGYLTKKTIAAKAATGKELTTAETTALLAILELFGDGITQAKKLPK